MHRLLALRRFATTFLFAVLFGGAGYVAFDLWRSSRANAVPDHDYLPDIVNLSMAGKFGEALAVYHYLQGQPGMPNRDGVLAIGAEIEKEQASWLGKASRFASGFVTGKGSSLEETAGTAISDFLVVGDVRDLGVQGYNAVTGREVDKMVAGLSAVGVAASAAALIPEPAEPAAAVTDGGISLLKGLRKIKAIGNRFAAEICNLAEDVLKTRKLGRFGELAETLGSVARHAPKGTLGTVVKDVETVDDLKAVARCVEVAPNEAVVALQLDGKEAASLMKKGIDQPKLASLLRKGAAGLSQVRPVVRGLKFVYRGRIGQIRDSLIDWLLGNPLARSLALGVFILFVLISTMFALLSARSFRKIFGRRRSSLPLASLSYQPTAV
ncbi:MAG TPA: hypothetical protein VGH90_03835 [Chthoniobacteraceae bacterium]